jgi:phenylacetate-CoA ligase
MPMKNRDERASWEARCLSALETALGRTPMYERWRRLDPGPRAGIDERFAALPALTKDDIRAAFPAGVVPRGKDLDAALAAGEVSFVSTSGTEDEALTNIWNQAWWNASERASWTLNAVASRVAGGSHPEALLASAFSVGPRSDGKPLPRRDRRLGRFLFLNEYGRAEDWPEGHEKRILAEVAEFRPAILEANPSLLARVARYAARTGAEVWQPPLITFTYEFTSALHMRDIRRVYSSPCASSYGSTEAGYVFMECEHGSLHQNTDFCRVDLVPLDGGMPAPAGIGKILVTTFGNDWFPLLRFVIGDVGRLSPRPCPCGRTFGLTLSAIEGRLKSLCVAADGRLVTHRELDCAIARVEGLEQYRIHQESPRRVSLAVVADTGRVEQVRREAASALRRVLGSTVDVAANAVEEIGTERSGKFLLVSRAFPLEAACA